MLYWIGHFWIKYLRNVFSVGTSITQPHKFLSAFVIWWQYSAKVLYNKNFRNHTILYFKIRTYFFIPMMNFPASSLLKQYHLWNFFPSWRIFDGFLQNKILEILITNFQSSRRKFALHNITLFIHFSVMTLRNLIWDYFKKNQIHLITTNREVFLEKTWHKKKYCNSF